MSVNQLESAILALSPLLYWPMQEASGSCQDLSGNAKHADGMNGSGITYQNSGPCSPSADYAIDYPGGRYAYRNTVLTTITNDLSIVVFYKYVAGSSSDTLLYNGNSGSNGWGIYIDSNKINVLLGGVTFLAQGTGSLASGWNMIGVRRSSAVSDQWKYYLNGAVDKANAGTNSPGTPSGVGLRIGPSSSLECQLAHAAVFGSALADSDFATIYAAASLADTPSAPVSPFVAGGNAQATVSWSAPLSDGGSSITSYKLYRGTTSGGETLLGDVGLVTSYVDTGLTNGLTYYYKVAAVNSVGTGTLSSEVSTTLEVPTTGGSRQRVHVVQLMMKKRKTRGR